MAYTYLQNGEPQKGLDIIDNNIDLKNLDRFKQHGVYGAFMHTMGALYYEVGEYKKAINYYKTSLKFDTKHNDINAILRTKEDLSKVYET